MKKNNVLQSRHENVTSADKFYAIAVFVTLLWQYCTLINDALSSVFMTVATTLFWFVAWLLFSVRRNIFYIQIKMIVPCCFLFLVLLIKLIISGNYSTEFFAPIQGVYQIYSLLFSVLIAISSLYLPKKCKIIIIKLFLIVIAITPLPSYYYVCIFRDAIRDQIFGYGIIKFIYIYSMIPLLGMLTVLIVKYRIQSNIKILMSLAFITNFGIIMLANFATCAILTLLAVMVGLLYNKRLTIKNVLIGVMSLIVALLLLKNILADIIFAIAESNMFSAIMKHRLSDIARLLSNGDFGSSFTDRFRLMEYSWKSFLRYPILGIPFELAEFGTLGFHETWVTVLGYSGLFGLVIVVLTIIKTLRHISKRIKDNYFKNAFYIMILIVFGLSFLNPILSKGNLMIVFCVIPMFLSITKERQSNNKYCGNRYAVMMR